MSLEYIWHNIGHGCSNLGFLILDLTIIFSGQRTIIKSFDNHNFLFEYDNNEKSKNSKESRAYG